LRSNASISGRAIASPMKNSWWTLCSSISPHLVGVELPGEHVVAGEQRIQVADWAAPWISGGAGSGSSAGSRPA
jgi:hypothetical protein